MTKELEALRMLEQVCLVANVANMEEQINLIETTLKKIDKAINLIKEKNVDVYWLRKSPSLPRYNIAVGCEQRLLKKEYNLLKEIFE